MSSPRPIRLNILSDLHLSQQGLAWPDTDADIVVLAGDIARPDKAIEWARHFAQPVIYVPGNHEFYGSSLRATVQELKRLSQGTRIAVLDQDETVIHGIRFLGATLWTDFMLYGAGPQRVQAIEQALEFIRDFSRIQSDTEADALFTPQACAAVFNEHCDWLRRKLAHPFNGPTVVITHHAPSPQSIHPRFAGSLMNTCFISNLENMMGAQRTPLWIHGHTHDSFDYAVNGTRVVCNPRGYAKDGINENARFNPGFIAEVAPR
jgi:predicted phosphodiesterase